MLIIKKYFLVVFWMVNGILLQSCATVKSEKLLQKEVETSAPNTVNQNTNNDIYLSTKYFETNYKDLLSTLDKLIINVKQKNDVNEIDYLSSDLFIKASDASKNSDYELSTILFSALVKLIPEDMYLLKRYSLDLIKAGNVSEAEKFVKELHVKNPEDEKISLLLAGVYVALDKQSDAVKIYREILKLNPQDEESCVFLAKHYILKNENDTAFSILEKCDKYAKNNGMFYYYLGKFAYEGNDKNLAIKYFQNSLKKDPFFFQSTLAIGKIFEDSENYSRAIDVYKKYLKTDSENFAVLSKLVQMLFAEGHFEELIPYIETLVTLDSSDLNMRVKLGILYTDTKRYKDAINVFRELLNEVPDSDKVLYYLGSLYQLMNDADKSIEYFSRVSISSDLFVDSSVQIAKMLQVASIQENVPDRFFSFIDDRSKHSWEIKKEMQTLRAIYHEEKGEIVEAISTLEKLDQSKIVQGNSKQEEGYEYYLASLYERAGDRIKARKLMGLLLEINPENADALNFIGYSLVEEGIDFDMAKKFLTKAQKIRPEDGYISDSLGWLYFKKGDLKRALKEVSKAYQVIGNDQIVLKHLAIIHGSMRQFELSKKYFEEALKVCKTEQDKEEIKKEMSGISEIQERSLSSETALENRYPASQKD